MQAKINKAKLGEKDLPSWTDLLVFNGKNRLIDVHWEGDFIFKEALEKPVSNYEEILRERSQLYSFLRQKRVIVNPVSPGLSDGLRNLTLRIYEDNKISLSERHPWHLTFYRIGPTHDEIIYNFNKLSVRIAQKWVEVYNSLHSKKEAFLHY